MANSLDFHDNWFGRDRGTPQPLEVVLSALGDGVCDGCLWLDQGAVFVRVFVLQPASRLGRSGVVVHLLGAGRDE